MKVIYVYRDALDSYQAWPMPADMSGFYAVVVPDGFDITGKRYNPATGEFDAIEGAE